MLGVRKFVTRICVYPVINLYRGACLTGFDL